LTQKEFFDDAARRFRSNAIFVPGASRFRNMVIDKGMKKTLIPVLRRFKRIHVLEVGCGVGRWTKILAEENSVIGVDLSRFMIAMARKECRGKQCSFVVADVSFLPFRENTFDLVVSIAVLQHLLDENKLFRALSRIAWCAKSQVLIVEEMWSTQVTLLSKIYCPIRILPLKSYIRSLLAVGLIPRQPVGITPAVLTVCLTCFLASRPRIVEGNLNSIFKASKLLSGIIHFVMGLGTLTSVLAPIGDYNPRFSLHTLLIAEKMSK
jgi:SAM-dependent methyltransferase